MSKSKTATDDNPLDIVFKSSTMLLRAQYDPESKSLAALFCDGAKLYCYSKVPPIVWRGLMNQHAAGDSIGAYMRINVLGFFEYKQVDLFWTAVPAVSSKGSAE